MQSNIPPFARLSSGSLGNTYPREDDQQKTEPVLCCGSFEPYLSDKPPGKLSFPHDALIADLIKDLMVEKRNCNRQRYNDSRYIGILLPKPPYIPPRFSYIVEVTTRIPNRRKIKVPQRDGNFVEKEILGFPKVVLANRMPFRWFVLGDENEFHASHVLKSLKQMSECGILSHAISSSQKKSFLPIKSYDCGSQVASQDMSWNSFAKTHGPRNEIPIRLKKKRGIGNVTGTDGLTSDLEYYKTRLKKQRLPVDCTVLELEKRTWVEIYQDDVPELFDNTEREYMGGLVLKYRCSAGCLASQGTEWSFQVLEPVIIPKSRSSIPKPTRFSCTAPSHKYFDTILPENGLAFACSMRHGHRIRHENITKAEAVSQWESESENESEGSSKEESFNPKEDDSMEMDPEDDAPGVKKDLEDSDEDYNDSW